MKLHRFLCAILLSLSLTVGALAAPSEGLKASLTAVEGRSAKVRIENSSQNRFTDVELRLIGTTGVVHHRQSLICPKEGLDLVISLPGDLEPHRVEVVSVGGADQQWMPIEYGVKANRNPDPAAPGYTIQGTKAGQAPPGYGKSEAKQPAALPGLQGSGAGQNDAAPPGYKAGGASRPQAPDFYYKPGNTQSTPEGYRSE